MIVFGIWAAAYVYSGNSYSDNMHAIATMYEYAFQIFWVGKFSLPNFALDFHRVEDAFTYLAGFSAIDSFTVQEYFADPPSITRVLDLFCASYNPTVVRLLHQIYKDAQDDRMSNLVNRLLTSAQRYILDEQCMASTDIKLVQLIVMLFQSMQWAVGVDSAVIQTGVEGIDMANLINTIVTKGLTMIINPLKTLA